MAKKKSKKKGTLLRIPVKHKGALVVSDVDLEDEEVITQGVDWVEVVKPSKSLLNTDGVEEFEWDEEEEEEEDEEE